MENKILRKHQSLRAVSHDILFTNNIKKKKSISNNNYNNENNYDNDDNDDDNDNNDNNNNKNNIDKNNNNYNNNEKQSNESITHLPALSKKKSITTGNLDIKKKNLKDKQEKTQENSNKFEKSRISSNENQLKTNLLLSNSFIEISRDNTGIKKKSLKNESIVDLIGSTNLINKENINTYTKNNTREKKIIPQWENLINDHINNTKNENKLRISTKIITSIDPLLLHSSKDSAVPSPSFPILQSPDSEAILSPSSTILSPSNLSIQNKIITEPLGRMVQSPNDNQLHSLNYPTNKILQSPKQSIIKSHT
eukprot:jgi/Orpsp1_1/1178283/evm.model.c7180000064700.1